MTNTEYMNYLMSKIAEIKALLDKDEQDGYILRPNVRERWVDHINQLIKEYDELIKITSYDK